MWWFSHHLKGFEARERLLLYEPQWENRLKNSRSKAIGFKNQQVTLKLHSFGIWLAHIRLHDRMWCSNVRSWMNDAIESVTLYRRLFKFREFHNIRFLFGLLFFGKVFPRYLFKMNGSFRNASGIWLRNVTKIRNNFLSPNSLDSC